MSTFKVDWSEPEYGTYTYTGMEEDKQKWRDWISSELLPWMESDLGVSPQRATREANLKSIGIDDFGRSKIVDFCTKKFHIPVLEKANKAETMDDIYEYIIEALNVIPKPSPIRFFVKAQREEAEAKREKN